MPTFRRFSVLLSLAVASLLFTVALPVAQGQTLASTASFSGSVSDSSGARCRTPKLRLNNPEKGITRALRPIRKAISPSLFCQPEPIP